jgi:hypothetical protein
MGGGWSARRIISKPLPTWRGGSPAIPGGRGCYRQLWLRIRSIGANFRVARDPGEAPNSQAGRVGKRFATRD